MSQDQKNEAVADALTTLGVTEAHLACQRSPERSWCVVHHSPMWDENLPCSTMAGVQSTWAEAMRFVVSSPEAKDLLLEVWDATA